MTAVGKRVFISVANSEHAAFRRSVCESLRRVGFDVVVQPDFPHTALDTVRKLDGLIAPCQLLVHIVGNKAGSVAAPAAVADFFATTPRTQFLSHLPQTSARLGDCASLTYFQWEPWLALHRRIPILVYGIKGHDAADFPLRQHLDNLRSDRHHAETLKSQIERCAQIVADVCKHFDVLNNGSPTALAKPDGMPAASLYPSPVNISDYEWDVFVSFRPFSKWKTWVGKYFKPMLSSALEPELGKEKVHIYADLDPQPGANLSVKDPWPAKRTSALARAKILVPLLCGSYWDHDWCLNEFATMWQRQNQCAGHKLIVPLIIHDNYQTDPHLLADAVRAKEKFIRENLGSKVGLETLVIEFAKRLAQVYHAGPTFNSQWSTTIDPALVAQLKRNGQTTFPGLA